MGPKPEAPKSNDLFRQKLDELINLRHPLAQLSRHIDWSVFERKWTVFSLLAVAVPRQRRAWWPGSCTCNTPLPYRMKRSCGAGLRIPTGSCSVGRPGFSTIHPLTRVR